LIIADLTEVCHAAQIAFDRDSADISPVSLKSPEGTNLPNPRYQPSSEGFVMRTFFGMILGALLLVAGVYVYDSMQTSSVANGQVAQDTRTIVNWDVAASNWNALKTRAHDDWIRISAK
jgi:hypothetical protein